MPTDIPSITYGTFYHIYNRGNNHENIFVQERNYAYFLELWWKHVSPVADTCAYCLLRNHFHIVVYIKNREDLTTNLTGLEDLSGFNKKIKQPNQYFSNFFNAYVLPFKEQGRCLNGLSRESPWIANPISCA